MYRLFENKSSLLTIWVLVLFKSMIIISMNIYNNLTLSYYKFCIAAAIKIKFPFIKVYVMVKIMQKY